MNDTVRDYDVRALPIETPHRTAQEALEKGVEVVTYTNPEREPVSSVSLQAARNLYGALTLWERPFEGRIESISVGVR